MYNQIKMYPLDEDKTDFTLGRGIYCYKVMPFILKNAGASLRSSEWLTKSSRTLPCDDMLAKSVHHTDDLNM